MVLPLCSGGTTRLKSVVKATRASGLSILDQAMPLGLRKERHTQLGLSNVEAR